jgi:S1-C subfamily serine protease
LILTIGYLILEADFVELRLNQGRTVAAEIVAYDYDTGFGLVRAREPLDPPPIPLGNSSLVSEQDQVLVAGFGGIGSTIGAHVVSRRTFAGYWEYLLEDAIFAAPAHQNWGGTALISRSGELVGVGSLFVRNAIPGRRDVVGNMFVPINLLKPTLADMLLTGRGGRPDKPWLGVFTTELQGMVVVSFASTDGPAARTGIQRGDVIMGVGGTPVTKQEEFYRALWAQGEAGVVVKLKIMRDGALIDMSLTSGNRYDFLKPGISN